MSVQSAANKCRTRNGGLHPSLPNYLWLEGGSNFGVTDDGNPSTDSQPSGTPHLTDQLDAKGIQWRAYVEDINGTVCPLTDSDGTTVNFVVHHVPFVYFNDVTNNQSSTSQYCIDHVRPYSELVTGLQNSTTCISATSRNCVAQYNFIVPNCFDDMHNTGCNGSNIAAGDTWLSNNVPPIQNSTTYKTDGAVFVVWDEALSGSGKDDTGPMGMILVSPFAKVGQASNAYRTHGSTLKTIQEIFAVTPLLGNSSTANSPANPGTADLSDLFAP